MLHLLRLILCLGFIASAARAAPVIYGISPGSVSEGRAVPGLRAITARIPEIRRLGANILWLMPVTTPDEQDGHGYDVMDYYRVWPRIGTAADLKRLVAAAHQNGMRVILDMVLNHSADRHPFVMDVMKNGRASPYWAFYQHGPKAGVPYAQHFHSCVKGGSTFVYYFWEHLLNFDYDQPVLRAYVLDVLRYWMREYQVDGYRFDASWGPSSRWPAFYATISRELRRLNPRVILLAEDKAGYPAAYEGTGHPHLRGSGFNLAYDWDPKDPHWMSKWSFQLEGGDDSRTVFNFRDPRLATDAFLRAVSLGDPAPGIRTLRYLENNDTPGFLRHHTPAQAAFAAKVMFTLPGVPLVFYGQEAGSRHAKFELPSFDPSRPMASYRPELWKLYQTLIAARHASDLLADGALADVRREGPTRVSYRRVLGPRSLKVTLDFSSLQVTISDK